MTTIINTPPSTESSDSGLGIVLGIIVGIVIVILFLIYGLPLLRNKPAATNDTVNVNVQLPTDTKTTTP
jgi:hypothetical protein